MGRRWLSRLSLLTGVALLAGGCAYLERASESGDGAQANGDPDGVALSGDGRYVAFTSIANNLVLPDNNGAWDVFVRDLRAGTIERVSVANDGSEGTAGSVFGPPALSDDGRFVAFASSMPNLVAGDTNGFIDVFVRDRENGSTQRVSVATGGTEANAASGSPAISADGQFVAFVSSASNLVTGDTNGAVDVFVHNRQNGATERVSVASDGTQANGGSGPSDVFDMPVTMGGDGRFVAFASGASNLVPADGNSAVDVFMRDRQASITERVSIADDESEGNGPSDQPSISDDGRYIAFRSMASNLSPTDTSANEDVFVRDRVSSVTTVETLGTSPPGEGGGERPALNGDGRWLAFRSAASNLVEGDTNVNEDIFVKDIGGTDVIRRVSLGIGGQQADSFSGPWLAISGDGRYAGFSSNALNLVEPDDNGVWDVFVRAVVSPTIGTITPTTVARGETTNITLNGTGFLPGAQASASALTAPGVTVDSVNVVSETELVLSVTADPGAETGTRHVTVWNVGTGPGLLAGASGICVDCLTVT
jgi:Tol biopolymer transport system component